MSEPSATSTIISKTGAAITYTSAGGAVLMGMTANELAALGGLIVAVVAMILNAAITWYFKSQHLKLARQRAEATGGNEQ